MGSPNTMSFQGKDRWALKAGRLLHTSNKVVAVVADDLAFLGHHAVAALGAGVEKFLGFAVIASLLHLLSEIQERGKRGEGGQFLFIVHTPRLTRPFAALNGFI